MMSSQLNILEKYWFYQLYKKGEMSKREFFKGLVRFRKKLERDLGSEEKYYDLIRDVGLSDYTLQLSKSEEEILQKWSPTERRISPLLQEIYVARMNSPWKLLDLITELQRKRSFLTFLELSKSHSIWGKNQTMFVELLDLIKEKPDPSSAENWAHKVFNKLNEFLELLQEFISLEIGEYFIHYNMFRHYPRHCIEVQIKPHPDVVKFFDELEKEGIIGWFVTGRSALMGEKPNDFDVVRIPASHISLDERKKQGKIMKSKFDIDFLLLGQGVETSDKFFREMMGGTDFTINLLLVTRDLEGKYLIVDPHGGYHDIQNKTLRIHIDEDWIRVQGFPSVPLPVSVRKTSSSPIRELMVIGLRAARFATQYSLTIEPGTLDYLSQLSKVIAMGLERMDTSSPNLSYSRKYIKNKLSDYRKRCGNPTQMDSYLQSWGMLDSIISFYD